MMNVTEDKAEGLKGRRQSIQAHYREVPPWADVQMYWHRDFPGRHENHIDCWCEPIGFRRSEFATADQAIEALERLERTN